MTRRRAADPHAVSPDVMLLAMREVEELHQARMVLDRYHIPTGGIDARITLLTFAPVPVRCYMCCKRTVQVTGLASAERPICAYCRSAACDTPHCYAPASVRISTPSSVGIYCAGHGITALPPAGRAVVIHHLTDGEARRAAYDDALGCAS